MYQGQGSVSKTTSSNMPHFLVTATVLLLGRYSVGSSLYSVGPIVRK